ncbi:hypothetical protein C8R44DRAFT_950893 [Mycena epipterygia]|nr:hypothetical protein C8R44DRAFT_950893 [Mycena epipterygia]
MTRLSTKVTNQYRYLQLQQLTRINHQNFRCGTTAPPHEAWKNIDFTKFAQFWNLLVDSQSRAITDSNQRLYYKLPQQLEVHHKKTILWSSEHSTLADGINFAGRKPLLDVLNSDENYVNALPAIPLPDGELDLSISDSIDPISFDRRSALPASGEPSDSAPPRVKLHDAEISMEIGPLQTTTPSAPLVKPAQYQLLLPGAAMSTAESEISKSGDRCAVCTKAYCEKRKECPGKGVRRSSYKLSLQMLNTSCKCSTRHKFVSTISRLAGGNTTRGRPVAGNAGGFPERTRDRCLKHEFGIQIFAAALLLAQTMALSNREKIFSVPALTDVPSSVEHGNIAATGMNTAISLPLRVSVRLCRKSPSSTGNLIKSLVKNFQLTISRFLFFYSIKQGTLLPRNGEIIDGVPGFSSIFLREVMAGVGGIIACTNHARSDAAGGPVEDLTVDDQARVCLRGEIVGTSAPFSNREKIFSVSALTNVLGSVEHGHIAATGMHPEEDLFTYVTAYRSHNCKRSAQARGHVTASDKPITGEQLRSPVTAHEQLVKVVQ